MAEGQVGVAWDGNYVYKGAALAEKGDEGYGSVEPRLGIGVVVGREAAWGWIYLLSHSFLSWPLPWGVVAGEDSWRLGIHNQKLEHILDVPHACMSTVVASGVLARLGPKPAALAFTIFRLGQSCQ